MADIADNELAELRQAHALLKSLYADAGVGMDFRKIVKKKFPSASIPELDAVTRTEELSTSLDKRVSDGMAELNKRIEGFENARKKEKEEADVNAFSARVEKIAKERGYTKEGTDKLLGIMKERGIQNPEDAAIVFEASQPKPATKPREFSSRMQFITPNGKDDEGFKKLMSDPDQFMMDEMMAALSGAGTEE